MREPLECRSGCGVKLAGDVRQLQLFGEVGGGCAAIHEPGPIRTPDDILRMLLVLLAEIAGDPFKHIVKCRDPEKVAIFVDHKGEVNGRGLKGLQQPQHRHGLRHEGGLDQPLFHTNTATGNQIAD